MEKHIGGINGLTLGGREFGVVQEDYQHDRLLKTKWIAASIKLQEKQEDGYVFGPGTFSIADRKGAIRLKGAFAEFFVGDTTSTSPLRSFALLRSLSIVEREGPGASAFLEDCVSRNLFGEGVSAKSWAQWNGIDFAFVTEKDLVELTRGFKSA